ncbi:LysR family transcriptional regulator [Fodinicola acaciae]|uniref:LysR family transcriptional regulator n=1 Tax=Fodinicola acaciae TaxID=2681555 RepID=UPI0013D0AD37|nr:LysR family transcriptional regulator [Fodinicola acaciae]
MQLPDLNLLPALDALLREESVTGAAAQLNVSASAMSRTLGRLRRAVGDPLLVPAGRGLTLTPHARELRPRVEAALASALGALRPQPATDLSSVRRDFAVRTSDGVAVVIGPSLVAAATREAPGIRLRILPEGDEDPADLRDRVDLDIGALGDLPPDIRTQAFGGGHGYVAVARAGAAYATEPLTMADFVAIPHVTVSRRGRTHSVVDERLADAGLRRRVLATVPTASAACFFALRAEVFALLPDVIARHAATAMPLALLAIPLDLPPVRIGQAWHARHDRDPAHQWLREQVAAIAA